MYQIKRLLVDTGIIIFKSPFYADPAPCENQLDILDGLIEFAEEINPLKSVKRIKSSVLYQETKKCQILWDNLAQLSDWALKISTQF